MQTSLANNNIRAIAKHLFHPRYINKERIFVYIIRIVISTLKSQPKKLRAKIEHITFDFEPRLFWIHSASKSPYVQCQRVCDVVNFNSVQVTAFNLIDLTLVTSSYGNSPSFGVPYYGSVYSKKTEKTFSWYWEKTFGNVISSYFQFNISSTEYFYLCL